MTEPLRADAIETRVTAIVADPLTVPLDRVTLCAESIDFLDILFRIETAFGIKIPEQELWNGAIDRTSQATIDASVAALKVRTPAFRWDRLPEHLQASDLIRLITVHTMVDYLRQRGVS